MIPHVIALEPGLIIYKIYNGYWFLGRPTLEELRQDLRAVTQKCRPDWDITRPELKAAWQQGRRELFYPYGKTYAKLSGNRIRSVTGLGETLPRATSSLNYPHICHLDDSGPRDSTYYLVGDGRTLSGKYAMPRAKSSELGLA
jgi:hypothetical protein